MVVVHPRLGHDGANTPADWRAKGKMRARDEGAGKMEGAVVDLKLVGDGFWSAIYTIPLTVGSGSSQKTYDVQVDTGSTDLWLASSSCSTSACNGAKGHLYDPSGAQTSGQTFTIQYLAGAASGPIVWDTVSLGPYTIDHQALAAASSVDREPLTAGFTGILGLALQPNSLIAAALPPTLGDDPDGAPPAANVFGLTPASDAPAARFVSLALGRPGSEQVASQLGIGRHPGALVPDPSKVNYSRLVADRDGARFWKTSVRNVSVWVGGEERVIDLPRGGSGGVFPSAVLDSGVPVILVRSALANAIYGALGIGPGSDGQYYIPCTTPLNISFTIGTGPLTTIPLHPLDLTASPPSSAPSHSQCTGLIQSADAALSDTSLAYGDMILGVPFLRSAYTVMAYAAPDAQGSFAGSAASSAAAIDPRLGLMPLTDPTRAMDEFERVRVQNQPLSSEGPDDDGAARKTGAAGNKGLSIGLKVLAGLGAFFALCAVLFLVRWLLMRRRFKRKRAAAAGTPSGEAGEDGAEKAYGMTTRGSDETGEETLRSSHSAGVLKAGEKADELGARPLSVKEGADDTLVELRGDAPWPHTAPLPAAAAATGITSDDEEAGQVAGAAGVGAGRAGHQRSKSGSDTPLLGTHARTTSVLSNTSAHAPDDAPGRLPARTASRSSRASSRHHPSSSSGSARALSPTQAAARAFPGPRAHVGGPALPDERPRVPITTAEIMEAGADAAGLTVGARVRREREAEWEASYF